jgi:hypothetical protein
MYSNKLNLKFLKLILFSEKNAVLDQINMKKKLKAVWDSNTRPALLKSMR